MEKGTKCYVCEKGNLAKKKVAYTIFGTEVGKFEAEVCTNCGEAFFDEEVSRKISQKTKEMGLWGLESKTKIGAVGSALDIRLSKKIVEFLRLKKGEDVLVYPESRSSIRVDLVSATEKRR
ncbi:MAG: YgiT-type zinc finger protein [Nanoarchaeota archaeon]|nr:YgiT-type zinc finger protein [Nanoarchaeota archaeon]